MQVRYVIFSNLSDWVSSGRSLGCSAFVLSNDYVITDCYIYKTPIFVKSNSKYLTEACNMNMFVHNHQHTKSCSTTEKSKIEPKEVVVFFNAATILQRVKRKRACSCLEDLSLLAQRQAEKTSYSNVCLNSRFKKHRPEATGHCFRKQLGHALCLHYKGTWSATRLV